MIVSKIVEVKIGSKNLKYYLDLGYLAKCGNRIEVKVEHLIKNSTAFISCKCDVCGVERILKFYVYSEICKTCTRKLQVGENAARWKGGYSLEKRNCEVCSKEVKFNARRCIDCYKKYLQENKNLFCIDCGAKIKSKLAKRCRFCANSGKNNPSYKQNLTDEERKLKQKTFIGLDVWRRKVFERDNFTCQKCNKVGKLHSGILHAHHIKNFDSFDEGRIDVDNGITFCADCHKKFHRIYRKKNNNEEQLREFLNDQNI